MGLILLLQALGFRLHFLLKQIPFLAYALGRILKSNSHSRSCIGHAFTHPGQQAIHRRSEQGIRRSHGLASDAETVADAPTRMRPRSGSGWCIRRCLENQRFIDGWSRLGNRWFRGRDSSRLRLRRILCWGVLNSVLPRHGSVGQWIGAGSQNSRRLRLFKDDLIDRVLTQYLSRCRCEHGFLADRPWLSSSLLLR